MLIRSITFVAALMSSMALSSCAELVKNIEEMQADDKQARAAQLMRIANSTRDGGDLNSALALYQRAHSFAPEDLPPLLAIGGTAYRLGLHDQATKAYELATKIAPESIEAHSGYGKTLIALGQPQDAIPHFETVTGLAVDQYGGFNGLGVAYDMLGRHGDAQAQYQKGLDQSKTCAEIEPDYAWCYNNIGLGYLFLGFKDLGIQNLQKAVALDPLTFVFQDNLNRAKKQD